MVRLPPGEAAPGLLSVHPDTLGPQWQLSSLLGRTLPALGQLVFMGRSWGRSNGKLDGRSEGGASAQSLSWQERELLASWGSSSSGPKSLG